MKNILLTVVAFFMIGLSYVMAQQPVPEPDTLRNPVRQIDPTPTNIPPSVDYTQNMVKITAEELPDGIKRTLQGVEYEGWEKAPVYKSKKGDQYLVEMRDGDATKVYRFNKQGQPVQSNDQK